MTKDVSCEYHEILFIYRCCIFQYGILKTVLPCMLVHCSVECTQEGNKVFVAVVLASVIILHSHQLILELSEVKMADISKDDLRKEIAGK